MHLLGECLLDMNQHNEALSYFKKALRINERATKNAENNTSLVTTLNSLVECLLKMNEHNEVLNYFDIAQQIYERPTTNTETDASST